MVKKNSELKLGKGGDKDKMKMLQAEGEDNDDDFDTQPRERTFTFSKALGEEQSDSAGSPQKTEEIEGDIDARKELLKKELMSLQE